MLSGAAAVVMPVARRRHFAWTSTGNSMLCLTLQSRTNADPAHRQILDRLMDQNLQHVSQNCHTKALSKCSTHMQLSWTGCWQRQYPAQAQQMCRAECFVTLACSAKALSKYSEMVDSIIRQQKDRLEAASDEARAKLREWDMPDALHVRCAAFSTVNARRLPCGLMCQMPCSAQAA